MAKKLLVAIVGEIDEEWTQALQWAATEKEPIDDLDITPYSKAGMQKLSQQLYVLLLSKTAGEAQEVLLSCDNGQGIEAWRQICVRLGISSSLELTQRMRMLYSPKTPKKVDEVAGAITRWEAEYAEIVKEKSGFKIEELQKKKSSLTI